MIRFERVDMGYGKKSVLTNVSLEIAKGDYVGLVGPNGSGKTTFLKTVLGKKKPLSGLVEVKKGTRFAYVPQAESLNFHWPLLAEDVVSLPLKAKRLFGQLNADDQEAIRKALTRAGILEMSDQPFSDLSGGQKQRVILAQALAQEPDALLLDEPTNGLDAVAERDFLDLLDGLSRKGDMALLLVTHALAIPLNRAERVFLFHKGKISVHSQNELSQEGPLENIFGVPFSYGKADAFHFVAPSPRDSR